MAGAIVSTVTDPDKGVITLPAASAPVSVQLYLPSEAATPLVRAVHFEIIEVPAPWSDHTPPDALVTCSVQLVFSENVAATFTASSLPSPFGETHSVSAPP